MDNISLHVNGADSVIKALETASTRLDLASRTIVDRGALLVANYAKKEFKPSGTPDDNYPSPTRRTGNLRNSIERGEPERKSTGTWSNKVGPTVVYGRRIELGFPGINDGKRGHQRTRAFPYLKPGFEKSRSDLIELYNSEWRKALDF